MQVPCHEDVSRKFGFVALLAGVTRLQVVMGEGNSQGGNLFRFSVLKKRSPGPQKGERSLRLSFLVSYVVCYLREQRVKRNNAGRDFSLSAPRKQNRLGSLLILFFIQIFVGNIILWNFAGPHFPTLRSPGALDAVDDAGLERVSFL